MKPEDMTPEQRLVAIHNLQALVPQALETGRKEGAAAAFGLMGLAESIRDRQLFGPGSVRRLMDMLAGWADYLQDCAVAARLDPTSHVGVSAADYQREIDAVAALYQQVDGLRDEDEARYVREFVLTRVLPALFGGAKP